MLHTTHRKILHYVCLLFFTLLVVTLPVVAQGPIDLIVGATHSFPWNVSGLKPGDAGSASIDLINNGTTDGTLYIWVDNISQTDAFGDGAALGNYMYFNVSQPRLVSTIALPARIDAFPTTPMTGNYLAISPVRPGETLPFTWTWEFVETGQLQNDAQGDSLRFDINYMLVNGPPPFPLVVPIAYSGYGGGRTSSRTLPGSELVQIRSLMNVTPTEEVTPAITTTPNGTLVSSPDMVKRALFGLDYWLIIIIGFSILIGILIINSQRK